MFKKILLGCILSLSLLISGVQAAEPQAKSTLAVNFKVDGLELPPDKNVKFDEGFITIQAKCEGEVKWLVLSGLKVKYVTVPQTKSIIVSIPPQGGITISIFAIGLVNNKLTDFARTNITVTDSNTTNTPDPPVNVGKFHITFVVDLNNTSPELAQVLNSQNLRRFIASNNGYFRLYDIQSPVISEKKLDTVVNRIGGSPAMIIQNEEGLVLDARKAPHVEDDVISVIRKFTGGQ